MGYVEGGRDGGMVGAVAGEGEPAGNAATGKEVHRRWCYCIVGPPAHSVVASPQTGTTVSTYIYTFFTVIV